MNDFAAIDEDIEYAINRSTLDDHWNTIIADGFIEALEICTEDAILELPQSEFTISGREEIRKYRATKSDKVVKIERIRGRADLWITEYLRVQSQPLMNIISIMEFSEGKVFRETEYSAERTAKPVPSPSVLGQ
jgi:hypothetical protein